MFKHLLVHVYAEAPSEDVITTATRFVKEYGGKLTLVDVVPDATFFSKILDQRVEDALSKATESKATLLKEVVAKIDVADVETRVLRGRTSLALIRDVLAQGHDLIIRETKAQTSRRSTFFGTTATRLLRQSPCPVLLLKPGHACPFARVAAAVDASNPDELHGTLNEQIMKMAVPFASGDLHNLHVISAWTMFGESVMKDHMREGDFDDVMAQVKSTSEGLLDDLVIKFGMGSGWENVHLFHGEPYRVLPEYVNTKGIDLLVMGSVGRAGLTGALMGNTAEQILNAVECSVLVTKPDGFVSPVTVG